MSRLVCTLLALVSLWAFAAPAFSAVSFDGPFPSGDYPFPVKDSAVEVRVDEATPVEWVDNERVIFSALKSGEPRLQAPPHPLSKEKETPAPGRVLVWNTRSGEIQDLGEGKLHCAYRGYVSYYWMVSNPASGKPESFFKSGRLGSEQRHLGWRPGNPPKHDDKFTCELFEGPRTATAPEYWTYQLRVQDGILAWTKKNQSNPSSNPVIWVRPDGSHKPLDINWPEVKGAWWEDWVGGYILKQLYYGGSKVPRERDQVPILYPDGRIERLPIADKYSLKNQTNIVALTRRGMVVTNDAIFVGALSPNKSTSGAYLVRGEQVVRLVDWLVGNDRVGLDNVHRGLAISPDGCKLAFKHGEGERRKVAHTIKMMDLCQGE